MSEQKYTFTFVEGYDDDPELSRIKGWVSGVLTFPDSRMYSLYFVTLQRLVQDASDQLSSASFYAEENMIIVNDIERNIILSSVSDIVSSGYVACLVEDRS